MEEEFKRIRKKPSKAWYLLPIFLGLIGGIIGYFLVKDRNKKMAKKLLIVGLVMIVIDFVLSFVITFYIYTKGIFSSRITPSCRPCFFYFGFVHYKDGQLFLKNGPKDITITSVDGGTLSGGPNFSAGDTINIVGIQTFGDVEITINYQDITTGSPDVDSAIIRN